MYKKKKNEKKFDCKKEEHPFISTSLQLQLWKTKMMIFDVNFVCWAYIYLVRGMYFLLFLFVNTCHDHELIRVKQESEASTKVYDKNIIVKT